MRISTPRNFTARNAAVPVSKRLLLVLAEGDKYDYSCIYCGTSLGDKLVKENPETKILIR